MQIGIKINNEFLELYPGTTFELEQLNPFLQFNNVIEGEHSLPFNVPNTPTNQRLLQWVSNYHVKKTALNITAQLMADGIPHSTGLIKFEEADLQVNGPAGSISIYYVFAFGGFWQQVKNKTLQDVAYNQPDVVWPFDTDWPTTFVNIKGYIKAYMNGQSRSTNNWVFAPYVNDAETIADYGVETIADKNFVYNGVLYRVSPLNNFEVNTVVTPDYAGVYDDLDLTYTRFTPNPYISWVLERIMATYGWQLTGAPLQDADYRNAILLHNYFIQLYESVKIEGVGVTWNIKTQVPKTSIAAFMLGLANRFGWVFTWDNASRTCTVHYRTAALDGRQRQDYTGRTSSAYNVRYANEADIYALRSKKAPTAVDFKAYSNRGRLLHYYQLPTAAVATLNHLYFIQTENAYYACVDDTGSFTWQKITDNTFDYEPANSNKEVLSACIAAGSSRNPARTIGGTARNVDFIWPLVTIPEADVMEDYYYITYYHGIGATIDAGGATALLYPHASSQPYSNAGALVRSHSLSWQEPNFTTGAEQGIYVRHWQRFLEFIKATETVSMAVSFTLADVLNFNYLKTILVAGNEYMVRNPQITLPLPTQTQMELVRV